MGGNGLQPLVRFQDPQLVPRYLVYLDARLGIMIHAPLYARQGIMISCLPGCKVGYNDVAARQLSLQFMICFVLLKCSGWECGRLLSSVVSARTGPAAAAAAAVNVDDLGISLSEGSLAAPGAPPAAFISTRNNAGDIGPNDFKVNEQGLMTLSQPSLLSQYAQMENWRVMLPENLEIVARLRVADMVEDSASAHCYMVGFMNKLTRALCPMHYRGT